MNFTLTVSAYYTHDRLGHASVGSLVRFYHDMSTHTFIYASVWSNQSKINEIKKLRQNSCRQIMASFIQISPALWMFLLADGNTDTKLPFRFVFPNASIHRIMPVLITLCQHLVFATFPLRHSKGYKSKIANYLHPCLLFVDIQF